MTMLFQAAHVASLTPLWFPVQKRFFRIEDLMRPEERHPHGHYRPETVDNPVIPCLPPVRLSALRNREVQILAETFELTLHAWIGEKYNIPGWNFQVTVESL